jgi:hypothetical protein
MMLKRDSGTKVQLTINHAAAMTGWPTPTTNPAAIEITANAAEKEIIRKGPTNNLGVAAHVSGWPTPQVADINHARGSREYADRTLAREQPPSNVALYAQLAGWPTPQEADGLRGSDTMARRGTNYTMKGAAKLTGWPTPTTRDHKDTGDLEGSMYRQDGQLRDDTVPRVAWMAGPARLTATGEMLTGSSAAMESGGQLNPLHSAWLMGYSCAWDQCAERVLTKKKRR